MFAFLGLLSVAQCVLSIILFITPTVSNIIAIVVLVSGLMGICVYSKLQKMEEQTQWLVKIAKEKGYKDPTERYN